jgi:CheY-like chemotaxis protein
MSKDSDKRDQMGRRHIFIVNRDPAFLELARTLLQDEEGYSVTTTNFIRETFDQIVALEPSLLIIDLTIGEHAGWDLLDRLQDETITRKIPVIVASTDPRLLDHAKANQHRYAGDCFLAKPLDIFELHDSIHSLISRFGLLILQAPSASNNARRLWRVPC